MLKHVIGIVLLSILVLIAGGVGLYIAGSPIERRSVRYDEIRLRDLDKIKSAIDIYSQDNQQLPSSIYQLLDNRPKTGKPYLKKELKDPMTKSSYSYRAIDKNRYELCAVFETSSEDIQKRKTGIEETASNLSYYDIYGDDKSHPKGSYCFTKTVAQYLFQKTPNPILNASPSANTFGE